MTGIASRDADPTRRGAPGTAASFVLRFDEIGAQDVPRVGGKNASLGEMFRELAAEGIAVPPGFATTAAAYRAFVHENGLEPVIERELAALHGGTRTLREAGSAIRGAFRAGALPSALREAVSHGYAALEDAVGVPHGTLAVAVRSSATAEDLPHASFAGRRRSSTSSARTRSSPRACAASPRSTPTAPSPTARRTASSIASSRSPSACSRWCARTQEARA